MSAPAEALAPTSATNDDPTPRGRQVGVWVLIGVVLVIAGAVGAVITAASAWSQRGALDPESTGPGGTRALVQILRQHGVEVEVVRDRDSALAALSGEPATLVLPDTPALSDDGLRLLLDTATDVVSIDPRSRTLDMLIPGARFAAGASEGSTDPACELGDAVRSGPIRPGTLFSVDGEPPAAECYPVGDGFALLVDETGERRRAAVDGTVLFTNEHLADDGNAALAVNLMGRHPLVVWYQPGPGDTDIADADPTLGDLTPPWVSPVIVLLLVAGVAAGIWRGRRFGPLVAERLPVTVRASETTEGRARLYAQSHDSLHAADQLRLGALERLGRALALGAAASAPEIADAAAARAGVDAGYARRLLLDDVPGGDADLVALSLRLRQFEDAVHAATRPERKSR
ncbi:DUF4350 domain-containing protein [Microbacterium thalassium]|uniref:DUF4350 domain-containing protein n=1 Tax=Microbacterium TaxID=33882 RepID=UPI002948C263|nr:DUF4350 domain-containing protein [Microbacterium thalassium]